MPGPASTKAYLSAGMNTAGDALLHELVGVAHIFYRYEAQMQQNFHAEEHYPHVPSFGRDFYITTCPIWVLDSCPELHFFWG